MSLLINRQIKVLVQGITGRDGAFHTKKMLDYGTNIVGGVTPGKEGEIIENLPVFNTVKEAVEKTKATASVIYVPAPFATEAIYEAVESNIELIICITEGIPVYDMLKIYRYIQNKPIRLIGPNCPGILVPNEAKIGIIPGNIAKPGPVGIVSKSGTLTYEIIHSLSSKNIGQRICIGIGGDPIIGTNFIDVLRFFNEDPKTQFIALIGEIGGTDEEEAAAYIKKYIKKPVTAFIAGKTAPEGKRMGHAGAIISGHLGTAESKIQALKEAGVYVCNTPNEISDTIEKII